MLKITIDKKFSKIIYKGNSQFDILPVDPNRKDRLRILEILKNEGLKVSMEIRPQ